MSQNLLINKWISVRRGSGAQDVVSPSEIGDSDDPIIEVLAPRADLKGALYQFLIGLVQTTFAPEDEDEWEYRWQTPPPQADLQQAFEQHAAAFELDCFMQDFDLSEGEEKSISALYIEAPGGKTLKDNLAHFVKGGQIHQVDACWAALSLFTLQINAPSGGVGHRVSLRGGGPLTTLVMPPPSSNQDTLWHRIWLNVLTQEEAEKLTGNLNLNKSSDIFPWLAPTRTSEKKDGETHPEHIHPYQMYWCMPRRIRLSFTNSEAPETCDITGQVTECVAKTFVTKNYGVNYGGNWMHPLTPYSVDPKKGALSIKGQPGGVTYRYWLGVVLDDINNNKQVAKVVDIYNASRRSIISGDFTPQVWAFGYDMDNMKARCWYESHLPLLNIPENLRDVTYEQVSVLVDAAVEVAGNLKSELKNAWFNRPKDVKGDTSFVDASFWSKTENHFYDLLQEIVRVGDDVEKILDIKQRWKKTLYKTAMDIFEYWAMSDESEDGDMERVITARTSLEKWLYAGKQIKKLAA